MTFITRHTRKGTAELLILLPIFIGLIVLVGGVGYLLIQKTKMEKTAWTLQIQGTYRVEQENVEPYTIETKSRFQDMAHSAIFQQINRIDLPKGFRAWISWYATRHKKLKFEQKYPEIVQHMYHAAFPNQDQEIIESSDGANLETDFVVMGHPLDKSLGFFEVLGFKNSIWAEEMKEAGFKYKFLDFVGYKELIEAGPIPVQILQQIPAIADILNNPIPGMTGPGGTSLPGGIL